MIIRGLETEAQLAGMAKKYHPRLRKRFQALILAKKGKSAREIAKVIGCSQRVVQIWVNSYNYGGIQALTQWWEKGRDMQKIPPAVKTLDFFPR